MRRQRGERPDVEDDEDHAERADGLGRELQLRPHQQPGTAEEHDRDRPDDEAAGREVGEVGVEEGENDRRDGNQGGARDRQHGLHADRAARLGRRRRNERPSDWWRRGGSSRRRDEHPHHRRNPLDELLPALQCVDRIPRRAPSADRVDAAQIRRAGGAPFGRRQARVTARAEPVIQEVAGDIVGPGLRHPPRV